MKTVVLLWLVAATALVDSATLRNPPAPAQSPRRPAPFAKGPLLRADLAARQLVIETPDGPRTFVYTDRTYIIREGGKVAPDKLKTGDMIAIRYVVPTNGVPVIHRLKAYPPPPPQVTPVPPEPLPAPTELAPASPGKGE